MFRILSSKSTKKPTCIRISIYVYIHISVHIYRRMLMGVGSLIEIPSYQSLQVTGSVAAHRNTPQHTATHCNTCRTESCCTNSGGMKHTRSTMQHTATHATESCPTDSDGLQHPAAQCNALQHLRD